MEMKKKTPLYYDNEIDLIALFKTIWDDKIKILLITIISFLIGLGYSYLIPNNYLISLAITKNNNFVFHKIDFINKILSVNQTSQLEKPKKTNQIIIDKFYDELQDYEEFLLTLKNAKKVKENNLKLPSETQKKELFKYKDLLKIKKKSDIKLIFKWDNVDEAVIILQDTINLTLNNLEILMYEELNSILEEEKKKNVKKDLKKLEFLKEQRWIAEKLNISDITDGYTGVPYYLRGYIAIDNEIKIIKKRDYKKEKEYEFIKQEINSLKNENIDWINYDINTIAVQLVKNTKLILIISILFGIILGIIYILISNQFKTKKTFKKNAN